MIAKCPHCGTGCPRCDGGFVRDPMQEAPSVLPKIVVTTAIRTGQETYDHLRCECPCGTRIEAFAADIQRHDGRPGFSCPVCHRALERSHFHPTASLEKGGQ